MGCSNMQLASATMRSCSISWTSEQHPTTSLMVVQRLSITFSRVLITRLSWTESHSQDTAAQKHQNTASQKRGLRSNSCLSMERFGGLIMPNKSRRCDDLSTSVSGEAASTLA